jgi:subtilisin family serine protease
METTEKFMLKLLGVKILKQYNNFDVVEVEIPEVMKNIIERLYFVRYVEPNIKYKVMQDEIKWNVEMVGAPVTWQYTQGDNPDVEIAILDTGIDYNHPEFQGRIISCESFVDYTNDCYDDNSHGTHVAGIAAAALDDSGMAGVAPKVQLAIKKVCDSSGSCYLADIIEGIDDTITDGNEVISMSFGGKIPSKALKEAIVRAYESGTVLVAAAGNGGSVSYPARYKEVIAVTACDENKQIPIWSSKGKEVELTAPGVNIYSTVPGGYAIYSGTSMAASHVSATAALLKAYDYTLTGFTIREILDSTAEDLGYPASLQGKGLVRADRAIQSVAG